MVRQETWTIERQLVASSNEHIRVKLPEGFDPARHTGGLANKIAEKQGEGFEFDSIVDGACQ
ncbi:hypothetical protein GCM10011577_10830 [Pseudarthrobacter polychromogenes]|uniref:Uncharacterized protein n=1 Tax=Pseudarthrobacter polychromogenes TaxID=1676 RepID=A0ABQ1XCD0_9MICC|nr:hypothetical protein GCM10011577_10830 [Pseudarthrobacter polychromogenes]